MNMMRFVQNTGRQSVFASRKNDRFSQLFIELELNALSNYKCTSYALKSYPISIAAESIKIGGRDVFFQLFQSFCRNAFFSFS